MTQTAQNTQVATKPQSLQELLHSSNIFGKLQSVLGSEKKAAAFASSVISVTNGNSYLRDATPMTVIGSAMVAATLDLPIVSTLGLAYIVPYKSKDANGNYITQAQFQIGYKGLIELAERSGQFRTIIDEVVYEGQLISKNKFTGEYVFDEDAKISDKVIGYMAHIELLNGFKKTSYWTVEEIESHAKQYSKSYNSGPWKTNRDAMAKKTVLKQLIAKYAPKSTTMQQAISYDQAVITPQDNDTDIDLIVDYADNSAEDANATEVNEQDINPAQDLFNQQ